MRDNWETADDWGGGEGVALGGPEMGVVVGVLLRPINHDH